MRNPPTRPDPTPRNLDRSALSPSHLDRSEARQRVPHTPQSRPLDRSEAKWRDPRISLPSPLDRSEARQRVPHNPQIRHLDRSEARQRVPHTPQIRHLDRSEARQRVPHTPQIRHLDRSEAKWRDPRISLRRLLQSTSLAAILLLTLGASNPAHRFEKLGHEMICTCGCGQILLECNHVGCPVSGPMIGELHDQLSGGGTNTSILGWFAAKYGATVMAAPMRGGFDNVAWITPFAVFFLATIGTAVTIRVWKLRSGAPRLASETWVSPETDALRARIRRETEY